jgi:hypothetical protein
MILFTPGYCRVSAALLLILGLGLTLPAAADMTAEDIDKRQAELNQQMNRVDEIARIHGTYVLLRETRVAGAAGFYPRMTAWFSSVAGWINRWGTITASLGGDQLASSARLAMVRSEVAARLEELEKLKLEAQSIRSLGVDAAQRVAGLRRVPLSYVAGYEEPIRVLNQQLDNLQGQLNNSLRRFDDKTVAVMDEVANVMQNLIENKGTALALRYPELEATVKEVNMALLTMQQVDREVVRLAQLDAEVFHVFYELNQPYHAIKLLKRFEDEASAVQRKIQNNPQIPAGVRRVGLQKIDALISSRREDIALQLNSYPASQRFADFYQSEVLGPGGLFERCQAPIPPKDLDCLLLRSYLIDPAKLGLFGDRELGVAEEMILKVKEGPLH